MVSLSTAPTSLLDKLLQDLEELMVIFLPVIAEKIGLSPSDVIQVEKSFHSFVGHLEGIEHGTLGTLEGIIYMEIDLLNILEVFNDDVTFPSKK